MNAPTVAPLKLERVSLEELLREAAERETFAAHNGRRPDVGLGAWLRQEEELRSEALAAWSVEPVRLDQGGRELRVGSWYDVRAAAYLGSPPRSTRGLRYAGRRWSGDREVYRFEHFGAAGSGWGREVAMASHLLESVEPIAPSPAQLEAAEKLDARRARRP